ncbi:dephospho-CoA kinase [Flavobacterium aquaticum]|uniref:Dephospho-CoA kinase n=1 Tax=Flavobacterium aquaticum TaxID=1236486 RepID=A0A327YYP1_9FLAO|nr:MULTISPECIES: dephospho-CoA kinase [Flavobacterium]MCK6608280.1 dephospho-CoA kinase [Flavobacterium sp.]RAK25057.1 dephospho-CoA kinase [Flavobacterium aquaticum]
MTKIIGLTGGIGSGKSTVANYIASKGIPVYIADEEAKKIMEREDVKQKIQNLFSESVLNDDTSLNRKKIAEFVFNNPEKLKELNAIVHPEVQLHFKNWLNNHKDFPFVIKEVAILFETGGNKHCDKVILITAPEELRIERAMKRDNLTKKDILVRINNQLPDSKKKKWSDFIIDNINLNDTFLKTDEILKILAKT